MALQRQVSYCCKFPIRIGNRERKASSLAKMVKLHKANMIWLTGVRLQLRIEGGRIGWRLRQYFSQHLLDCLA